MSKVRWLPLESNPDVMNKYLQKLGVPKNWGISDVISLDDEIADKLPTPSLAVLLLFPTTPTYVEYRNQQEKLLKKKPGDVDGVYFMKPSVKNACGTVALIHALANNESLLDLKPESVLKKFLDSTRDLSPEEKGKYLEQDEEISAVHESSAQQGQTETPNLEDDVNLHFLAIVNVNDKLVELDGCQSGPLLHGTTSEKTFIKDAFGVCKDYIEHDPDNLNFNALVFGAVKT